MTRTVVAIGMFDGVHLGHVHVLHRLRELAALHDLRPAVVTFANHPRGLIRPERAPRLLTTLDERLRLLRAQGIEHIVVLPFDAALQRLTARQFAESFLKGRMDAAAVMVGYDNRFGSDRLAGVEAYRDALSPLGLDVYDCPPCPGVSVSSSLVRLALSEGRLDDVYDMLGRPFRLSGTVVHGRRLGRTLGFPTANIDVTADLALPKVGVYAARVAAASANDAIIGLPVMLNIGTNPTVDSTVRRLSVEAHIIAADSDAGNLYGSSLAVDILARLRDERQFADLEALVEALRSDRAATLRIVGN